VRYSRPRFIDVARFANLIPTIVKLGCKDITLFGGEPLMHPDIDALIGICRQAGLDVTIFTNGTLLSKKIVKVLRTRLIKDMVISLYGASDYDYKQLSLDRDEHLFSAIRSGIKSAREVGLPYRLQVFYFRGCDSVYEHIKNTFPEEQIIGKAWRIIPRSADNQRNQECMIDPETMSDSLYYKGPIPHEAISLRQYLYEQNTRIGCVGVFNNIHITTDFMVKPCMFIHSPEFAFSLDNFSLEEIFFKQIPFVALRPMDPDSPCQGCDLRKTCYRCAGFGYGTTWAKKGNQIACRIAKIIQNQG
jgi:MoaA/NifB/PqqE/SkfB family radical SAM enzyme